MVRPGDSAEPGHLRTRQASDLPGPRDRIDTYSARGALTPELAAHVVGTVGPITAQGLKTLGPPYANGAMVGQSGIEQAYERQLAGTPGAVVQVSDQAGGTVAVVGRFPEHPGTPVTTTIDPSVQEAAESALTGQPLPAAIVAIQSSTGDVLASVSTPDSQAVNEAFDGAYPPGSTFKVVTSTDLIERGLTPSSPATCPSTITVNGEVFHNFEGETTPSLSLQDRSPCLATARSSGWQVPCPMPASPRRRPNLGSDRRSKWG